MDRPQEITTNQNESGVKVKRKTHFSPAAEFLVRLSATVLILWIVLTFVAGIYVCHSDSCSPMVKDGDLCVTWKPGTPSVGELIIYVHDGKECFGRVIANGGDRVEIREGFVYVNGFAASQNEIQTDPAGSAAVIFPFTVPENSVFVLCDNSVDMNDSRSFGAILLDDCRGKVIFLMRRRGI